MGIRDRADFVGNPDDIVPATFGRGIALDLEERDRDRGRQRSATSCEVLQDSQEKSTTAHRKWLLSRARMAATIGLRTARRPELPQMPQMTISQRTRGVSRLSLAALALLTILALGLTGCGANTTGAQEGDSTHTSTATAAAPTVTTAPAPSATLAAVTCGSQY